MAQTSSKGIELSADKCIYCLQNPTIEDEKACRNLMCRLKMQLSEIPGLYVLAAAFLTPGSGGHGSSSSERTIGVNMTALEYRAAIDLVPILTDWEDNVRVDQSFSSIAIAADSTERITTACKFLFTQLDWLSGQYFFGDFVNDIESVWRQGKSATRQNQAPVRRIECPADFGDGLCLSLLTLPENGDKTTTIRCHRCRTEWTIDWLIEVALATQGSEYWLDAESIANHLQIENRQVRRLARKWKIKSRGQLYDLNEFNERYLAEKTNDTPKHLNGA